jgi:hypothetical protein
MPRSAVSTSFASSAVIVAGTHSADVQNVRFFRFFVIPLALLLACPKVMNGGGTRAAGKTSPSARARGPVPIEKPSGGHERMEPTPLTGIGPELMRANEQFFRSIRSAGLGVALSTQPVAAGPASQSRGISWRAARSGFRIVRGAPIATIDPGMNVHCARSIAILRLGHLQIGRWLSIQGGLVTRLSCNDSFRPVVGVPQPPAFSFRRTG